MLSASLIMIKWNFDIINFYKSNLCCFFFMILKTQSVWRSNVISLLSPVKSKFPYFWLFFVVAVIMDCKTPQGFSCSWDRSFCSSSLSLYGRLCVEPIFSSYSVVWSGSDDLFLLELLFPLELLFNLVSSAITTLWTYLNSSVLDLL